MSEYIKREDADKTLCDLVREYNREARGLEASGAFEVLSRIRLMPAANVVPVVNAHDEKKTDGNTSCSNCGVLFVTMYIRREPGREFGELVLTPNYCPNCGAKMEEDNG